MKQHDMADQKESIMRMASPPPRLRHYALALIRIVRGRWLWRRQGFRLHFRPLDGYATELPAVCGATPSTNVTTQPGGVGCYRCALFIEADVGRWAPKPKQRWEHDPVSGLTSCMTCGGVDGYPPGCRCPGGIAPEQPTVQP